MSAMTDVRRRACSAQAALPETGPELIDGSRTRQAKAKVGIAMDLQLEGKTFLITGGSTGLGRALAEQLVKEGAYVALMARDGEKLSATAEALRAEGGEVLDVAGDVKHIEDLTRFVEAAKGRWGRIDGVVNNAGELAAGAFADQDDTIWQEDVALKLMGAVRLTRLALPALRESRGAVVNTLAISAKAPDALTGTPPERMHQ